MSKFTDHLRAIADRIDAIRYTDQPPIAPQEPAQPAVGPSPIMISSHVTAAEGALVMRFARRPYPNGDRADESWAGDRDEHPAACHAAGMGESQPCDAIFCPCYQEHRRARRVVRDDPTPDPDRRAPDQSPG